MSQFVSLTFLLLLHDRKSLFKHKNMMPFFFPTPAIPSATLKWQWNICMTKRNIGSYWYSSPICAFPPQFFLRALITRGQIIVRNLAPPFFSLLFLAVMMLSPLRWNQAWKPIRDSEFSWLLTGNGRRTNAVLCQLITQKLAFNRMLPISAEMNLEDFWVKLVGEDGNKL